MVIRPSYLCFGNSCIFKDGLLLKQVPGLSFLQNMMTSSNGNIFRFTGPLCREFTGPGEFRAQRPVTRSFDVFFHLHLNKRLSKQPRGWWFETPPWSLWRQCNVFITDSGIILHMRPANERCRYIVTSPLIGWVRTQNDPCRFPIALQWHHMSVMTLEITKNMPVCSSAYPG